MMDLTTTQTHRRVGSGRVKVEVDLTTPPPPSPSKKHALEHDLRSGLPKSKKVREAQDTTEAKTDEKQPLVHPTPQQRDLTLATLDRAEPAGIGYDETDRPSFVASRRFFARISKEDSELKSKVAAPYEYYNVELSATGLGKDCIVSVGLRLLYVLTLELQNVSTPTPVKKTSESKSDLRLSPLLRRAARMSTHAVTSFASKSKPEMH